MVVEQGVGSGWSTRWEAHPSLGWGFTGSSRAGRYDQKKSTVKAECWFYNKKRTLVWDIAGQRRLWTGLNGQVRGCGLDKSLADYQNTALRELSMWWGMSEWELLSSLAPAPETRGFPNRAWIWCLKVIRRQLGRQKLENHKSFWAR